MPDRGRAVEFGVFVDPRAAHYADTVRQVQLADRLGLDVAGLQDHPYLPEHLDMWILLVDLAARTTRIRLFPDVANLPLRHPAILAKAAASLDVVSGGRVDIGLGAGGFWDGIAAMGGPRRTPPEAVAALAEALDVMRTFWSGKRGLRTYGDTYALSGAHAGPLPTRRIELWVGALGPRMLELTGRSADGWLPSSSYVPPEELSGRNARIDEAAAAVGRDPGAVRRLYNVSGSITDGASSGSFTGPVAQVGGRDRGSRRVGGHGQLRVLAAWGRPASIAPLGGGGRACGARRRRAGARTPVNSGCLLDPLFDRGLTSFH